jgi:hypothetical protein
MEKHASIKDFYHPSPNVKIKKLTGQNALGQLPMLFTFS